MEFIKKLLWKERVGLGEIPMPQPETVTLAYHKSVVAIMSAKLATARAEAAANAAELAQWRQYGQMRDPATGRLVPRVKAEVA